MQLILVRHAIAVDHGTAGMRDADRPLTEDGARRFAHTAAGLARICDPPEVILTSPLLRARQTAEILRAAFGHGTLRETDALAWGSLTALEEAVHECGEIESVAAVGHEPHLSEVLASLLGASESAFGFKKGGTAFVEVPDLSWKAGGRLRLLLTPRVLRSL